MIRFQAEQQRIRCSSTILFPTSKETCRVLPVAMSETDGCESPTNSPISCCVNPDRVSASISDLKSIDHIIGKPMSPVNRKSDLTSSPAFRQGRMSKSRFSYRNLRFDVRMRVVALKGEIFVLEREDALHVRVDPHHRKTTRRAE